MHSRGDVGAQFRHSASSVLNISDKSLLCSLFRVDDRTLSIFLFSLLACQSEPGVGDGLFKVILFQLLPVLTRVIKYDSRHI